MFLKINKALNSVQDGFYAINMVNPYFMLQIFNTCTFETYCNLWVPQFSCL